MYSKECEKNVPTIFHKTNASNTLTLFSIFNTLNVQFTKKNTKL